MKESQDPAAGTVSGDANVVSHSTITDNRVINNTTKELSEAERLRHNKAEYHNACAERYNDGLISEEGLRQLAALRVELGLHKDIAEAIEKEVKELSIRKKTSLPQTGKNRLAQVRFAIEANDIPAIKAALTDLSSWRQSTQVDELDQMYFQLKAFLSPAEYIRDLERPHEETYWELFWSYVARILANDPKAESAIAALTRWDNRFSEQNQVLLQITGALMREREAEARMGYQQLTPGYSEELQPLKEAIEDLLDRTWRRQETDISPRSRFYVETLFRKVYDHLRAQAQETRAAEIAAEQERESKEKELRHRKEDFLQQYEATDGDAAAALAHSGATQLQLDEWKRFDADFTMSLRAIDKRLSDKKEAEEAAKAAEEERRLAEEAQAAERTIQEGAQKDAFKRAYEANECDLRLTCAQLNLGTEEVRRWRLFDPAFDNALSVIKQDHDRALAAAAKARRQAAFKRALPFVLIALLVLAGGYGIYQSRAKKAAIQQEQEKVMRDQQRELNRLVSDFNVAIPLSFSETSGDDLQEAYRALQRVREYEIEHSLSSRQSEALKKELKKRCTEFKNKAHEERRSLNSNPLQNAAEERIYTSIENTIENLLSQLQ